MHLNMAASIIFWCKLHCLMNMATGLLVIAFKTVDISLMVTGLHADPEAFAFSMVTSTARLKRKTFLA
jgi:hypothetical protein